MANEEAQKRYLRRLYAKRAEQDKDEQWKDPTNRLSYFEKIDEQRQKQERDNDGTGLAER